MSSPLLLTLSAAAASADAPPAWVQFMPLIAMVAIFWFLIIRPQMRRQKEHQAKVSGIKKGDQVLTGGGFVARVIKVDDHYAELELGPNVKVKALKSTIADVIPPGGTAAAND
jgi:preprotein translocase subunit YajC